MRAIVELGHAMKPNKNVLAVLLELVCTGEAYLRHHLESVATATSPAPPSRLSQLAYYKHADALVLVMHTSPRDRDDQ